MLRGHPSVQKQSCVAQNQFRLSGVLGSRVISLRCKSRDTYTSFFAHLSTVFDADGLNTELMADTQLVFGSNEERALVNAIRRIFHRSSHVFCTRHIVENVQRHLTDKGVQSATRQKIVALLKRCMDVSADTSAVTDANVNELLEFVRLEAPEHVDYMNKHVLGKVWNNIHACIYIILIFKTDISSTSVTTGLTVGLHYNVITVTEGVFLPKTLTS